MRITVAELRALIRESIEDEITQINVGDLVDVALDHAYGPYRQIRVLKLVPNVAIASGVTDVMDRSGGPDRAWNGPGFLGVNEDPENDDMEVGEQGWFTMDDVITDSQLKYYVAETIEKCGGKWCLYSKHKKNGKRRKLGTHDTEKEAQAQERAIKAHGG